MNNSLQVNLPRSWASSSGSLQEKSEHSFFLFYYYRMEDEAVLDRGASFLKHVCDDEEVEGKELSFVSLCLGFVNGSKVAPFMIQRHCGMGNSPYWLNCTWE